MKSMLKVGENLFASVVIKIILAVRLKMLWKLLFSQFSQVNLSCFSHL